jgi:hypothetical protein
MLVGLTDDADAGADADADAAESETAANSPGATARNTSGAPNGGLTVNSPRENPARATPSALSNRAPGGIPMLPPPPLIQSGNRVLPTPGANTGGVDAPVPIQVIVSTQQRSFVYYRGPATYVRADAFAPRALEQLPHPANDNGRGLHWFPTTQQTRAVVDRFIPELIALRIRWVVILQGLNDWDIVANDYLIDQLNRAGIMPIIRIEGQVGKMNWARVGWAVARYRERGARYFQIFNEPNLKDEWSDPGPRTPERFAEFWAQGAQVVAANGGLPGFAPMSPKADDSDLAFFRAALGELVTQGRWDLINLMWISIHNYGGLDANGFYRYRRYDAVVREVFGATQSIPMIATEAGLENADATATMIAGAYRFIEQSREPYLLAYAPWLIGNFVGGGHDPTWEPYAWFTGSPSAPAARSVVGRAKP